MKSVRSVLVILLATLTLAVQGQTFNIFAAASLKESATEIAHDFEKRYPNFKVILNFGGSQQLVAQIRQGAPVDVLLSAGIEPLKSLEFEKSSLRIFAYNSLALIVPKGSNKVRNLKDIGFGPTLILADRHVPVGHYTELLLEKAKAVYGSGWLASVQSSVTSREQDVRAVLAKVALGEADAGFVYKTDVATARGKVKEISIPDGLNVEAKYVAVRFANSSNADLAKDFLRFLFEKDAQKALVNQGFGSPIVPGGAIKLDLLGRRSVLTEKLISSLPHKTFLASEHGVKKTFHGYDLTHLLSLKGSRSSAKLTIIMTAGDGYSQTVDLGEAIANGIFLVGSAHDNYQIILPQKQPKFWVHWVREIVVQ